LDLFVSDLDGSNIEIKEIHTLYPERLFEAFCICKQNLQMRFETATAIFKQQNWIGDDSTGLRQWSMEKLNNFIDKFPWNTDESVKIIPQCHGTDFSTAQAISITGFATLSLLDSGWYGQGIYFSSSAKYTIPYFATKPQPTIIISYVIPGNVYPVIESSDDPNNQCGRPIKAGYQSHYISTTRKGKPITHPTNESYDELVIGQEFQVVPAFILRINVTSTLISDFMREVKEKPENREIINMALTGPENEDNEEYKRVTDIKNTESELEIVTDRNSYFRF
jgi:hypothetical protein